MRREAYRDGRWVEKPVQVTVGRNETAMRQSRRPCRSEKVTRTTASERRVLWPVHTSISQACEHVTTRTLSSAALLILPLAKSDGRSFASTSFTYVR